MIIGKFSDLPVGALVKFIPDGPAFRIEENNGSFVRIRSTFNPDLVITHTDNLDRLILNYDLFRNTLE